MAALDYFLPGNKVDLQKNSLSDKLIVLLSTSACCIAIYAGERHQFPIAITYRNNVCVYFSAPHRCVEAFDERSLFNHHFLFHFDHIPYFGGEERRNISLPCCTLMIFRRFV